MGRIRTFRVEMPIGDPHFVAQLLPSEHSACADRPVRSVVAAVALKQALAGLARDLGIDAGVNDFHIRRDEAGAWTAAHWPKEMPRPRVSVSHTSHTAVALAAVQEEP